MQLRFPKPLADLFDRFERLTERSGSLIGLTGSQGSLGENAEVVGAKPSCARGRHSCCGAPYVSDSLLITAVDCQGPASYYRAKREEEWVALLRAQRDR